LRANVSRSTRAASRPRPSLPRATVIRRARVAAAEAPGRWIVAVAWAEHPVHVTAALRPLRTAVDWLATGGPVASTSILAITLRPSSTAQMLPWPSSASVARPWTFGLPGAAVGSASGAIWPEAGSMRIRTNGPLSHTAPSRPRTPGRNASCPWGSGICATIPAVAGSMRSRTPGLVGLFSDRPCESIAQNEPSGSNASG
jgi:hypothetical protein